MRGTRRDGAQHLMRGVIIFGVRDERAAWARFFLEPVDPGDDDATAAVRQIIGASSARRRRVHLMSVATESTVRDARPPGVVVRVTNLIVRPLLRTPAAKLIKPLALLEFHGRRSGQRRRVVVAWHVIDDVGFVITPARWRANFVGGHPTTVYHRGSSMTLVGTLVRPTRPRSPARSTGCSTTTPRLARSPSRSPTGTCSTPTTSSAPIGR